MRYTDIEYLLESLRSKLNVGLKWLMLKCIPEEMRVHTNDFKCKSAMKPPYQPFCIVYYWLVFPITPLSLIYRVFGLSQRRLGFNPEPVHLEFVMENVVLRQVFLSISVLCCHYHYTKIPYCFIRLYNHNNIQRCQITQAYVRSLHQEAAHQYND